jgi:hypothetical protein
MTPEEQIAQYRDLLQRAADRLQAYAGETMGDMNDSLAMEIYKALEETP